MATAADPAEEFRALRDAWSVSARAHLEAGRTFFIAKLNLSHTDASYLHGPPHQTTGVDAAGLLQAIVEVGWTRVDTGYVFQSIRERSHIVTDSAQVEGNIIGIFTFRRADDADPG
jgi:hypothetical protein